MPKRAPSQPSKFKWLKRKRRRAKEKKAIRNKHEIPIFKTTDEWDWNQMFDSGSTTQIGVYIGRFNPIHKGHQMTLEKMLHNHTSNRSLIVIGSERTL